MLIRYKDPTHWHPFALKEGAGWILPAQGDIWRGEQSPPTAIQASSLAADSPEAWANRSAASLLMQASMVRGYWHTSTGLFDVSTGEMGNRLSALRQSLGVYVRASDRLSCPTTSTYDRSCTPGVGEK